MAYADGENREPAVELAIQRAPARGIEYVASPAVMRALQERRRAYD
jgi:hypothetical protein